MSKTKFNAVPNGNEPVSKKLKEKLIKATAATALSLGLIACGTAEKTVEAESVSAPSASQETTVDSTEAASSTAAAEQSPEIQTSMSAGDVHDWLNSENPQTVTAESVTPTDSMFNMQLDFDDPTQVYAIGTTVEWTEGGEDKVYSNAVATNLEYTDGNFAAFTNPDVIQQATGHDGTITVWSIPVPDGTEGSINEQLAAGAAVDGLDVIQEQVFHYGQLNQNDQAKIDSLVQSLYTGEL